jgi:hypothetical protein
MRSLRTRKKSLEVASQVYCDKVGMQVPKRQLTNDVTTSS